MKNPSDNHVCTRVLKVLLVSIVVHSGLSWAASETISVTPNFALSTNQIINLVGTNIGAGMVTQFVSNQPVTLMPAVLGRPSVNAGAYGTPSSAISANSSGPVPMQGLTSAFTASASCTGGDLGNGTATAHDGPCTSTTGKECYVWYRCNGTGPWTAEDVITSANGSMFFMDTCNPGDTRNVEIVYPNTANPPSSASEIADTSCTEP